MEFSFLFSFFRVISLFPLCTISVIQLDIIPPSLEFSYSNLQNCATLFLVRSYLHNFFPYAALPPWMNWKLSFQWNAGMSCFNLQLIYSVCLFSLENLKCWLVVHRNMKNRKEQILKGYLNKKANSSISGFYWHLAKRSWINIVTFCLKTMFQT